MGVARNFLGGAILRPEECTLRQKAEIRGEWRGGTKPPPYQLEGLDSGGSL